MNDILLEGLIGESTENLYKKYAAITEYINTYSTKKLIDFNDIVKQLKVLLENVNNLEKQALELNLKDNIIFIALLDFLSSFKFCLELDIVLNENLEAKANGGKYSIFSYIKDTRKLNNSREILYNKVCKLNNFYTDKQK